MPSVSIFKGTSTEIAQQLTSSSSSSSSTLTTRSTTTTATAAIRRNGFRLTKFISKSAMALTIWTTFLIFMIALVVHFTNANYWDRFFHALPGSFRNDDTNRDIYELIESRGFIPEKHYARTPDGYILQMVRIINPFVSDPNQLKPILLHHGFQCTGTLWLVARNGSLQPDGTYEEYRYEDEDEGSEIPDTSVGDTLAFVLASRGYDVWLANYRGSIYSTNHTNLSTESAEFWSFSIDEMIVYDIPSEIDYILSKTQKESIAYIGHSQGNLMMLALMSLSDRYTNIIKPFIAISPVFYNLNIKGSLLRFIPMISYLTSNPQIVPYSWNWKNFITNLCENILTRQMCFMAYYRFTGSELKNINWPRLTVYTSNVAMGSSAWNAAQLFQLYSRKDGLFSAFDAGNISNLDRYGQPMPPFYDATEINSTDIALIYAANDWLNPLENVHRLKQSLRHQPIEDYLVPDSSFGHLDLIWARNVGSMVNKKIMEILNRY